MKRTISFAKHRVLVIVLLLTAILTSCEQFGYLTCPVVPNTVLSIPPPPYDEEVGDCSLVGKSEEIEAWLTELERIAESCRLNREENWADTLAVRDSLDSRIDKLDEVVFPTAELGNQVEIINQEHCPNYTVTDPSEGGYSLPSLTHYYTDQLKSLGEDVEKYCAMIDELVKPLWQACDKINFYQDCQAPNPEQYHSIVEYGMYAAQIKYDYTDFFYTNTLQTYGWDVFMTNYNESYINCTPAQPKTANPTFTFSMNAFCRVGPTIKYEKVATFLELQSVQIDGRSQREPLWWWVLIPGSQEHCWAADSTGKAAGSLEDLEFVAAPLLVISPENDNPENVQPEANTCSKDLGQMACAAAGGTWTQSAGGPYYCDCK